MAAEVLAALAGEGAQLLNMTYQDYLNDGNVAAANQMNQQNQREAGLNNVFSLKNAGLSPALANTGNFSPVQTSPLAAGIAQAPNMLEAAQIAQNQSLIDEQVALLGAQREHQELQNTRLRDEDLTIDSNLRGWIQQQIKENPHLSGFYDEILNRNELYSKGSLDGIIDFSSALATISDNDLKKLSNKFFGMVKNHQIDNGIYRILGDMPKLEQENFFRNWSKISAEVAKLLVDTDLDKTKIVETNANIHKIIQDTKSEYHKDYAAMIENKDYLSAAISLLGATVQAFGTGAGFGSAAYLTKGKTSSFKGNNPRSRSPLKSLGR